MSGLFHFTSGAAMMGAWVCSLFFFRFWRKTQERLFFLFGLAFWTLGLERFVLVWKASPITEENAGIYLIRLAAFLMILYAIWDKNRSPQE